MDLVCYYEYGITMTGTHQNGLIELLRTVKRWLISWQYYLVTGILLILAGIQDFRVGIKMVIDLPTYVILIAGVIGVSLAVVKFYSDLHNTNHQ